MKNSKKMSDKTYLYNKSFVIKFTGKRATLSTGIINGGYREDLNSIFNHDVKTSLGMGYKLKAPTYREHIEIVAKELGLDPKFSSALGTAAYMENMSIISEEYKDLIVTAYVTAGIETNGGRVGDPASYNEVNDEIEKFKPGTINIMVAIDGNLPPRTLTRALITITEAKVAAIQELLEGSKYSTGIATGSGTDGVIVYCNLESDKIYNDAGKHSKLGELIGIATKRAVKEALAKQSGLTPETQKSIFRRGKRYGISIEKVWEKYLERHNEKFDKKLETIEFLKEVEKNEELVALTSLYIHLLDQLDWGLLSKNIVNKQCNMLAQYLCEILQIDYKMENKDIKNLVDRYIIIFVNSLEEK